MGPNFQVGAQGKKVHILELVCAPKLMCALVSVHELVIAPKLVCTLVCALIQDLKIVYAFKLLWAKNWRRKTWSGRHIAFTIKVLAGYNIKKKPLAKGWLTWVVWFSCQGCLSKDREDFVHGVGQFKAVSKRPYQEGAGRI